MGYNRRIPAGAALLVVLSSHWFCCGTALAARTDPSTNGYNCLFLGHSFFAPIARSFAGHPDRCGFPNHKQTVVFQGGENGSPGKLWDSQTRAVTHAKKLLESGTVDLVGLTCARTGSDIADYRRWVDLALTNNPKTRFIIQAPWATYQNKTFVQYEADSETVLTLIHQLIDELRRAYPQTTFLCIPQGRGMVGLWRLFDEGKLPEISSVKGNSRAKGDKSADRAPCLFLDDLGHGGELPVEMGALLWLAVIYKVDLNQYQWQTNTRFDLKKLAQDIVKGDPYCGLESNTKGGSGITGQK